jgi:hypothetical protein
MKEQVAGTILTRLEAHHERLLSIVTCMTTALIYSFLFHLLHLLPTCTRLSLLYRCA